MRDGSRPTTQLIKSLRSQAGESGGELVRKEFIALARILAFVLVVMSISIYLCR